MDIIKIVKINSYIISIYMMIRFLIVSIILFNTTPIVLCAISLLIFALSKYLTANMWKGKGMLSLTFSFCLVVSDIVIFIITKLFIINNPVLIKLWMSGIIGLIIWILFMVFGYINNCYVRVKQYDISSSKIKGNLIVCLISDIHYGTIQKNNVLINEIDKINGFNPDIVLFAGDLTEEKTSNKDMKDLFVHLKRIKAKYGLYFVNGNHDKQQKLPKEKRTYTDEEFNECIKNANIKCLDDSLLTLDENITIIGRNDYNEKNRLDFSSLVSKTNKDSYRIVLEHQPEEYEIYAKNGIDMQLTGHYHGAQNWPNNILYGLANIKYTGLYNISGMKLIVNNGFAGSLYPVRTHSRPEYVIIRLHGE